jgi:hypothetical protein
VGDKPLTIDTEPFVDLYLAGKGAMNHPATPYQTGISRAGLSRPEKTLAPGEAFTLPIKSLDSGHDRRCYWLLPGEYTLIVSGFVYVPPAEGAAIKRSEIVHWSEPVRLKVVAGKK